MKPFYGNFSDQTHDEDSQIMAAAVDEFANHQSQAPKVHLSEDVMNKNVKIEQVEHELLSNPANAFKISFSTDQPGANIEILIDDQKKKQIVDGEDECSRIYSACE